MTLITRHILLELLKIFLLASTAITVLMVLLFLVHEGWREQLTVWAILQLIPYTLPTSLCFAIPGTILFAACVIYGRMSATNELVAIQAAGAPPWVALQPGFVLAFLLSLLTVFLNDLSVSWGRRGVYRVILHSSAQTIYTMLRTQGTFAKGRIYIDVDEVRGEDLINPFITRLSERDDEPLEMRAERARIFVDPVNDQLVIELVNGHVSVGTKLVFECDHKEFPVPLGDVTKKTDSGDSPSNMQLREIPSELVRHRRLLSQRRRELAMRMATQSVTGDMVGITHPRWSMELDRLQHDIYREHRLRAEPWRRWANGFSCLGFLLIGAPLAMVLRRFDFWTNFAICFLPILLLYYPLMMFGVSQTKSGALPPLTVWTGNVVLALIGLWLIRRVHRT